MTGGHHEAPRKEGEQGAAAVAPSRGYEMLGKRLFVWFTYNVVFALMPFALSIFFRVASNKFERGEIAKSPEILFFALMIAATASGDLSEAKIRFSRLFKSSLLIGAVLSAVLYGALLYDTIVVADADIAKCIQYFGAECVRNNTEIQTLLRMTKPSEGFRSTLLTLSFIIAALLLIIGTYSEILIGNKEDEEDRRRG